MTTAAIRRRRQLGVTLLELMVTIAILGIIVSIGLPSFRDTIMRNRLETAANAVQSDIAFARSESIRRGRVVSICPANIIGNADVCLGNTDWGTGWLIFVDDNRNGVADAGERRLRSRAPENNVTIGAVSGTLAAATFLQAMPAGELSRNGTIRFCHAGMRGIEVTLQRSGSVRSARTAADCT